MLKTLLILLLFVPLTFADKNFTPSKIQNPEPVPYTLELLKQAVDGISIVDVYISDKGLLDSLYIVKSINRNADILISQHLKSSVYTPAFENGVAVPSVMQLEFEFSMTEALKNLNEFISFGGIVIDSASGESISNVEIECRFINPEEDKDLKVSFDKYLEIISKFSGQHRKEDRIATVSKSNGRFEFYGFPFSVLEINLTHSLYKKRKIRISDIKNVTALKTVKMVLKGAVEIKDSKLEIVVSHKKDRFVNSVVINKEIAQNGLTDDLNSIVSKKSSVVSSNQSNSRVLINGGGLYDNSYILNGISIYTPTHFPFFSNLDKNGLVLADVNDVRLITNRLSGRHINSTGGVIDVSTIKNQTGHSQNRTGGTFDLSYEKVALSLSQTGRNGRDDYLFSYSMGQKALMRNYTGAGKHLKASANYGYGDPLAFYDFQFKTFHKLKKGFVNSFSWFGIDQYYGTKYYDGKTEPVGFGSITYSSSEKSDRLKVTVGGSRQYFDEGKRIGTNSPLKEIERKNVSIVVDKAKIKVGPFDMNETVKFENVYWDASIRNRIDSANVQNLIKFKRSEELLINKLGLEYSKDKFTVGIDVNMGTKFEKNSHFIDPGIWMIFPFFNGDISFSGGVSSSYPDMRGVPSKEYGSKPYKTSSISSRLRIPLGDYIESSIEPYLKYAHKLPKIGVDPLLQIWDEDLESATFIRGVNGEVDFMFPKFLTLSISAMISKSDRYYNGKKTDYEWEIPWQLKGTARLFFVEESFNLYFKPSYTSGMAYYDYANNGKIEHRNNSFTLDAIFEYHVRRLVDTPIELMEAYIGLRNISFTTNDSEIFWAEDMTPLSYNLTPLQLTFGARASIGKKWKKRLR